MHFINQVVEISPEIRVDTKEEECTSVTGKFISPGLPPEGARQGEVTLIPVSESLGSCSIDEGWIAYGLNVSSDYRGSRSYAPGVLGNVVNFGEDDSTAVVIAISPMQFTQDTPWDDTPH